MADLSGRGSTTIPLLPATSLDESLAFWETLGFEVTRRQKAPNAYGVVRYEDFELHLFGLKRLEPANNFTTCLVIVAEVEQLHASYAARLNQFSAARRIAVCHGCRACGRVRRGSRSPTLRATVIFMSVAARTRRRRRRHAARPTPLQRAVALAERMRDFKNDDAGAARALDHVLQRYTGDDSPAYRRAIEARIALADTYEEIEHADELRRLSQGTEAALAPRHARRLAIVLRG